MVDEDTFFWDLSLGMLFIAGIADILFIWILHYTSTRYPRPNDDGKWNQSAFSFKYPHDCCKQSCNEDLSRCCCGLRCRKITCPMQCNCCYPLELFIPRYPSSFFSYLEPEANIDDIEDEYVDDANMKDLELKSLKNSDEYESKVQVEEEEKDNEIPRIKRRQSSLESIEENSNLRVFHDRYGKCCCCSCFSILFKIWFLLCGILSFAIFIIFSFTMFFELWVKCATWQNGGEFFAFLVIIFIVCKIFIWFLYHSFQACCLLVHNTCDANNILIVEWWRFWQVFWCVMFAVIYLDTVDPEALTNALIGQSIARFMVIQGIVWIVVYWIAVILGSIWLIINLFECHKNETFANCLDCINPYKWKWVKQNSLCMKYCDDYAQILMVFEDQKWTQYKLTYMDFLTGLRPYSLGNKLDNKYLNYCQYFWILMLILLGIIFIIVGYVMGNGFELMLFSGWSFLIYYVLMILIKRDDFDGVLFKMWNGISYKKIYSLLKEISSKHSENYYYSYLSNNITGCDVIILRYVDIWSMFYYHDAPNFWSLSCGLSCGLSNLCYCGKNDKKEVELETNTSDHSKPKYSMWQLKQFNIQLWLAVLLLIIPFSILVWASTQAETARLTIQEYDKLSVSKWNWSANAIGQNEYPFCHSRKINNYLNGYDLIYLSQSGWYFDNENILNTSFKAWFGINDTETGWNYDSILINFVTQGYEPSCYYIENRKYKIDLIVIRGSYTAADWMQDANLWSQPILIQLMSFVVPINNIFGDTFLRDLVYLSSAFQGLIFPQLRQRYDEPIYRFIVEYLLPKNTGNTILITGHSLGGGVTDIVASRLRANGYANMNKIYGFGLSPPGTLWSSKKFGYDFEDLDASVLNVVPRRDPVPMIDKQGGMIQYINCGAYKRWACHSAIRSMCEIYHSCGYGNEEKGTNIKNVQFVQCLCIDMNDWNNCTMLVLNETLAS